MSRRIPGIAEKIAVVQLSDTRQTPRCDNDRLPPGKGILPIAEIVAALETSGYDGYYEVDVWSRDLWKSPDRDLLQRSCGDAIGLLKAAREGIPVVAQPRQV